MTQNDQNGNRVLLMSIITPVFPFV